MENHPVSEQDQMRFSIERMEGPEDSVSSNKEAAADDTSPGIAQQTRGTIRSLSLEAGLDPAHFEIERMEGVDDQAANNKFAIIGEP